MRIFPVVLAGILLICAAPHLARAAWTVPASFGNDQFAMTNPSCAFVATNDAVCAMGNANHKLTVTRLIAGTSIGWQVLDGVISSDPTCTPRATKEVVCVARGLKAALVYTIFNGTSWSKPATVRAPAYSDPSCARLNATKILCVMRNQSGTWSSATFTGTVWSSFIAVTGPVSVSPPSCAGDFTGKAICAAVGVNTNLIVNRFNGTVWEGYLDLGGSASNTPVCARAWATTGSVRCMVRGNNMSLFTNRFQSGAWTLTNWTGFIGVGGLAQSTATSADNASDVMYVVVGIDSRLYANRNNGGWLPIGGTAIGNVACTDLAFDKFLCAVRGTNNRLLYTVGP